MKGIQEILSKWDGALSYLGYFSEGKKEQQGIVRTSCLDSLDRTNAFQAIIGWKVLELQMSECDSAASLLLSESSIYEKFRGLWARNGNQLSIQYTGTESTTAALTMDGTEGFLGAINHGLASVGRFFKSNFVDDFKQECINILLNRKVKIGK